MRAFALLIVFALALPLVQPLSAQDTDRKTASGGGDRLVGEPFATRAPVIAQKGMAATSQPLASQIAIDILKAGGSAVDAAIAANAALALMEPTGNGIGGDLFAIVYDPETGELHGLNASGRAPQGLTLDELKEEIGDRDGIPLRGPLPVSVPSTVDGWYELHERFGSLPMEENLAPAIRYAREGFPLTQLIAYYWGANFNGFERAVEDGSLPEIENARETYLIEGEDGELRAARPRSYHRLRRQLRRLPSHPLGRGAKGLLGCLGDAQGRRGDWMLKVRRYGGLEVWKSINQPHVHPSTLPHVT